MNHAGAIKVTQPDRDARLKIPLREGGGADVARRLKATLEKFHGPLTWDDFFQKLPAYIDITERDTVTWMKSRLAEVEREMLQHNLGSEAQLLHYFTDLLAEVMLGKVSLEEAENALLYAGVHK